MWCKYARDFVGAPLEEEWGEQGGLQDFMGGTMLWIPEDGGIYVLLNRGDWRFEPVESSKEADENPGTSPYGVFDTPLPIRSFVI